MAGIVIASNFDVKAALPLDGRTVVADLTARDAIDSGVRFEGMTVYVESEETNYQLIGGITDDDWTVAGGGIGSLDDVGGTPNSKGGSIAGSALKLHPADGSNPGLLTAGAQTIGGAKSFADGVMLQKFLQGATIENASSGTNLTLTLPDSLAVMLSAATSVSGVMESPESRIVALFNGSGAPITFKNEDSVNVVTSTRRIITGTGADLIVLDGASILMMYDSTFTRWRIIGGSGSGGSAADPSSTLTKTSGQDFSGDLVVGAASQTVYAQSSSGKTALSTTPFGNSTPPAGTRDITIVGAHDANYLTIAFNDANYGCVGPFSEIEFFKFKSVTFRWLPYITRYQYVSGVLA